MNDHSVILTDDEAALLSSFRRLDWEERDAVLRTVIGFADTAKKEPPTLRLIVNKERAEEPA